MERPKFKKSPKGIKCKCFACGESDCGCGADWSDNTGYNQAITDMEKWINYKLERLSDTWYFAEDTKMVDLEEIIKLISELKEGNDGN